MSTWNYRIVSGDPDHTYVGIYEVYYDDAGRPFARTSDPIGLFGDSVKELRADLSRVLEAFEKPVLSVDEIGANRGRSHPTQRGENA